MQLQNLNSTNDAPAAKLFEFIGAAKTKAKWISRRASTTNQNKDEFFDAAEWVDAGCWAAQPRVFFDLLSLAAQKKAEIATLVFNFANNCQRLPITIKRLMDRLIIPPLCVAAQQRLVETTFAKTTDDSRILTLQREFTSLNIIHHTYLLKLLQSPLSFRIFLTFYYNVIWQ